MTAAPAEPAVEIDELGQVLGVASRRNETHSEGLDLEGAAIDRRAVLGAPEALEKALLRRELEIEDPHACWPSLVGVGLPFEQSA
jgi:hypothetical protein